jgi:RNA polymerase sigma factor (sigma-70 family)
MEPWGISASMTARHHQQRFDPCCNSIAASYSRWRALYSRSVADRDDLMQEISTQLWRSFGSYDEARAKFSTWMYRIALNVAISQARRERWSEGDRFEPLEARHLETVGGGESIAEPDERLAALYAFIGQLDELNRALICCIWKTAATTRSPKYSASAKPTWRPRSIASNTSCADRWPARQSLEHDHGTRRDEIDLAGA